jgi:MtN3 and saliva related transmembrane protein
MATLNSKPLDKNTQNKKHYNYHGTAGYRSVQQYSLDKNNSGNTQGAMDTTDWIGSAAATLTTAAFIPQAWKIWQTRHTADISLGMYALFTAGVALWLTYGILLSAWPIIIANSITLLLAGTVLVMKLKFG